MKTVVTSSCTLLLLLAALLMVLCLQANTRAMAEGRMLTGSVSQTASTEPGIVGLDMRIMPEGVTYPLIQRVFNGTPAFAQGILPGDMIMEVDSETTLGKSHAQVDAMISDMPGATVMFTLLRGKQRVLKVPVTVAPRSSVKGF